MNLYETKASLIFSWPFLTMKELLSEEFFTRLQSKANVISRPTEGGQISRQYFSF